MKTTLDLPDELMKAVKLRAVEENRTMTDLIAEYLRRGLTAEPNERAPSQHRVKLPLIEGTRPAKPGEEITPERVAEILLAEEIDAYRDSLR